MPIKLSPAQKLKVLTSYLGSWFCLPSDREIEVLKRLPKDQDLVLRISSLDDVRRYVTFLLLRDPGRKDYRVLHLFEVLEIQFQRSQLYESITDIRVPWLFCIVNFHQLRNNMANEVLFQLAVVRKKSQKHRTVLFLFDQDEEVLDKAAGLGYHVVPTMDLMMEARSAAPVKKGGKAKKKAPSKTGKGFRSV